MTAMRFDRGELRGSATRTDEGYIRADAIVTRVGVLTYRNADGSLRRELRHPDDVFHADSLASLRLVPITNDHPPERVVNAGNAKALSIGSTGENVRHDEQYVMDSLLITHEDGVKAVEGGKRELSCGYTLDLVREDGVYEGQPYEYRQTNIRYNHVAIVRHARAGGMARLNLDAADAVEIDQPDEEKPMLKKVNLDGIEYDAAPEVVNALTKAQARADAAEDGLNAATAEKDKLAAERDNFKERLDAAEKVDHTAAIADGVKVRVTLLGVAARVDKSINCDGLSDIEIKKAVITKKFPKAELDGKSDAYITARFDGIVEDLPTAADANLASQREHLNPRHRADAADGDPVAKARQQMIEKQANAYKQEGK